MLSDILNLFGAPFFAVAGVVISALATAHVVLNKRDTRAALGWVGVVWLAPFLGAMLYLMLGINRIRRRASRLRPDRPTGEPWHGAAAGPVLLPPPAAHLERLARLGAVVANQELTHGNAVTPLLGGEAAYAEMLAAIDAARHSVALATYIFDHDEAGLQFVDALARAHRRGVAVRVLVDGLGAYYSWPQITKILARRGVRCARFMHSLLPWRMAYLNLRSHRKILVVDGRIAFTGGMNIRAGHLLDSGHKRLIRDLQFRLEGPVVAQIATAFQHDWQFTTGEELDGPAWFPALTPAGDVTARAIVDGPDEDIERLDQILIAAVSQANHTVRIVTPYFIPDRPLIAVLNSAALKGVRVDIVIPRHNNLPLVHWAMMAQLGQFIDCGCRVFLSAPPFDHSKMTVIDGIWVLIGTPNWDARSLRLNFELSVEVYDAALATKLEAMIDDKIADSLTLTRSALAARPLPIKLRDGIARLLSPYL